MKLKFITILLSFIGLISFHHFADAQETFKEIRLDDWMVSKTNRDMWFPAKVPASVHTAMYEAKRIPDPFKGDIEERLQFIGQSDWTYQTTLHITEQQLKAAQILLEFKGLDTYSDIYINNKKTFTMDNMFRTWQFDIKSFIHTGDNEIKLIFHAPLVFSEKYQESLNIDFPGGPRVWARKAQYQFGWDWAPTYLTMGIWRPVYVKFAYQPYITATDINYRIEGTTADIEISADIMSFSKIHYHTEAQIAGQSQKKAIELKEGLNKVNFSFKIENVELWWPNGMGEQKMYHYQVAIGKKKVGEQVVNGKTGFRKVELITIADKAGESFYFKINNRPVFAKGANYVPADAFPEQITDTRLTALLSDAKKSNFNMLRVWGGGIYESNRFYELCDSLGLMIWQDFMFACAMYPGEEFFLENIRKEAEENVERIARHPCVVLWCGNNENAEGWARWGWQDKLSTEQKKYLETAYSKVFDEILPQTVRQYGKKIPYWESSPKFGRGDIRHRFEGDAHYWGVWHDGEDFSKYEEKVPRFMSEFGFQSYPEMSTIRYFSGMELKQDEPSMLAHQKHPRGNQLIDQYIRRTFNPADDFESFVYLSQVIQAEGVGRGIAAQRTAMPFCMGSLYWQLNDCWPAISWSSIDYFGKWKPLQYKAKELFKPVIVNTRVQNDKITTNIVSDIDSTLSLDLEILVYTTDGTLVNKIPQDINITSAGSVQVFENNISEETKKFGAANLCYVSRLYNRSKTIISEDCDFAVLPKDLNLSKDKLTFTVKEIPEGYLIEITSTVVNPGVFLTTDLRGTFSDNYFNMLPGTKTVTFKTDEPSKNPEKAFQVMTWTKATK
ncbi:MAG TPA: hypothetical protein PL173_12735 [Saprospiraceae bacterium]|nr:hypothetical protein [Saprospiraceae bacterium]